MKEFERQISDVVECLGSAKERATKCSILIGAGCSISAGIPAAGGFVKEIEQRYPKAHRRAADPKGYPQCMKELPPGTRRQLIAEFVDNAKLNWGHLAIAQLMKEGYVDRVLTTNFDPLVLRACNLVGVFPSVFDFAASQTFQAAMVDSPAVYFLHGQRSGFVLLNTEDALKKHFDVLKPVFSDAGHGRAWIIAGYSGENDPVFDHLKAIDCFNHELHWITNGHQDPKKHVQEGLLQPDKYAFYVKAQDSDSFFCELAIKLGCFPPLFITEPFAHFLEMIKPVMDFTPPISKTPNESILEYPRNLLQAAIENQKRNDSVTPPTTTPEVAPDTSTDETKPEAKVDSRVSEVLLAFLKSDYDRVLKLTDSAVTGNDSQLLDMRADAFIALGNQLYEQGTSTPDVEAVGYLVKAAEKYQQALAIKPDMHEALYNWGVALGEQAKLKDGAAADKLWAQAAEKYQQALAIKPDKHEALLNWGNALDEQAKRKDGAAADELWAQAIKKYQQALAIKPDMHDALNNWSAALLEQAKRKAGDDRENLLILANEKCQRAEEIQAGAGAYNLACIATLRGNQDEARHWLEKCVKFDKLPTRRHVEEDADLESLRGLPWFEEILQKAPQS